MLLSIQASLNSIISFRPGIVNRVSCVFSVSSQHTNYLKSIVQYGHENNRPIRVGSSLSKKYSLERRISNMHKPKPSPTGKVARRRRDGRGLPHKILRIPLPSRTSSEPPSPEGRALLCNITNRIFYYDFFDRLKPDATASGLLLCTQKASDFRRRLIVWFR